MILSQVGGGPVVIISLNSVQLQLQLPAETELGNKRREQEEYDKWKGDSHQSEDWEEYHTNRLTGHTDKIGEGIKPGGKKRKK